MGPGGVGGPLCSLTGGLGHRHPVGAGGLGGFGGPATGDVGGPLHPGTGCLAQGGHAAGGPTQARPQAPRLLRPLGLEQLQTPPEHATDGCSLGRPLEYAHGRLIAYLVLAGQLHAHH